MIYMNGATITRLSVVHLDHRTLRARNHSIFLLERSREPPDIPMDLSVHPRTLT